VSGDRGAELSAALLRAEVLVRRERFADALALLDAAKRGVAERDLAPDLDFLRGDALARLGRYPEAQAAFEAEIRRFPRNTQTYSRLAIVLGLEHRPIREIDRLLEAMYAAVPTSQTAELASNTLKSMGDAQGASRWLRRAPPASR